MSVTFKKVLRKDPFHKDGTGKYYPQLIVWGKSATLESIAAVSYTHLRAHET